MNNKWELKGKYNVVGFIELIFCFVPRAPPRDIAYCDHSRCSNCPKTCSTFKFATFGEERKKGDHKK